MFLDRKLAEEERGNVSTHLESCPACTARLQSMQSLRAALRLMGQAPVPAALATQLRVLASHERLRHASGSAFATRLRYWGERLDLLFQNMMRPMAVPLAGGLLSALLLFGMLVPKLVFHHDFSDDLQLSLASDPEGHLVESLPGEGSPIWLWKGGSVRLEPVGDAVESGSDSTVLELTIDEYGRVASYSVNRGQLTPEMESLILFSRFTPASFFGKNTWGKVRVSFSRLKHVRG